MDLSESEEAMEIPVVDDNAIQSAPSMMHHKVEDLYPDGTNLFSIRSPPFESLSTGRLNTRSLSPRALPAMGHSANPFGGRSVGIIPGPMSLSCSNAQFVESWLKYVVQSAICVTTHSLSFLLAVLWLRFVFSSYLEWESANRGANDLSRATASILSQLPSWSWIWVALCFSSIAFSLGFQIQLWVTPIQWNFEDAANTELFRVTGICFVALSVAANVTFSVLELCSFALFHRASALWQLAVVMLFSFVLLFFTVRNGRSSSSLNAANPSGSDIDLSSDDAISAMESAPPRDGDERARIDIVKRSISRIHRITEFANNHSPSKLMAICAIFSLLITATMVALFVAFSVVLPSVLRRGRRHVLDRHFLRSLAIILCAAMTSGKMLILGMRVLTRWLTVLLTADYPSSSQFGDDGQSRPSVACSFHAHYGSMQSLNRMVLFAVPLMFCVKLTVFVMLYVFVDPLEFAVAVALCCAFGRGLDHFFGAVENRLVAELMRSHCDGDYFEDDHSMMHLQHQHLLAQCSYINDIVHYIGTLMVPILLCVFAVDFDGDDAEFSRTRFLKAAATQFLIQSMFDLFPLLVILWGNPGRPRRGSTFQELSPRRPFVEDRSKAADSQCCGWAMRLKVQYINMMNGWTATDRCVRHFMWWCSIFIGGYFAFVLLYPQQFLCAVPREGAAFALDAWSHVECQ